MPSSRTCVLHVNIISDLFGRSAEAYNYNRTSLQTKMASSRYALTNFHQNQENATSRIAAKTALNGVSNKPLQATRRAALDDLGNRLANQLSQNGCTQKTAMGPPTNVLIKKVDVPKKHVTLNKENVVIKKDAKPLATKKINREESILVSHTNRAAVLRQEATKLTTKSVTTTVKEHTKEVVKQQNVRKCQTIKVEAKKKSQENLNEKCKEMTIIDPDENTRRDPQMVAEYVEDILTYVREIEETHPIEEKFLNDSKVTPKMRATLVNWLVDVHRNFSFELETLHLCVSMVDRYLMVNQKVDKSIFQLVGTSALLLASKYEELFIPELSDFVYICDGAFTKKQILQMEKDILRKLEFRMGWPLSIFFLRRYSKIAQVRSDQHTLAKYILELALLEYGVAHVKPSIQAAAACCLSIAILTEAMDPSKLWTSTMVHYTTYKYSDLKVTLQNFAHLLKKAETCKFDAIREKYSHAKFEKISLNFKLQGPLMRKLTTTTNCTF